MLTNKNSHINQEFFFSCSHRHSLASCSPLYQHHFYLLNTNKVVKIFDNILLYPTTSYINVHCIHIYLPNSPVRIATCCFAYHTWIISPAVEWTPHNLQTAFVLTKKSVKTNWKITHPIPLPHRLCHIMQMPFHAQVRQLGYVCPYVTPQWYNSYPTPLMMSQHPICCIVALPWLLFFYNSCWTGSMYPSGVLFADIGCDQAP